MQFIAKWLGKGVNAFVAAVQGTPLIDLEPYDGSTSQVWPQDGSTLVNEAAANFLDDPNPDTSPGTAPDLFQRTDRTSQASQLLIH
jgi:hypothetical protein